MGWVVTIDGPAGAGKSTVARLVAERLGWRFLDTGAMYRAVALAALERSVDLNEPEAVGDVACSLDYEQREGRFLVNGVDCSESLRDVRVTDAVKRVADYPQVRAVLADWQRAYAAIGDTVTEGRDQGTLIFPDAVFKLYLTASPSERARRRFTQMVTSGVETSLNLAKVQEDQHQRDARDEGRAIAPLRPAEDAVHLDSTELDCEAVVERVLEMVRTALNRQEREVGGP